MTTERNVLGEPLEPCGTDPMTGFYRDGTCSCGDEDAGLHAVCAVVTEEFLEHQRAVGNDLTQYTLAAERGNPGVATLSDALDPGVLQLVDHVCQAARGQADVAVCGEVASDEVGIPLLLGLGVRELSVGPHAVPRVKARVRDLDLGQCQVVAKQALRLDSAGEVREFVQAALTG